MVKTKKGRKAKSGFVSGNSACGKPLPGKIFDFAFLDFGVRLA